MLTIKDISMETGLEESLLRFYESEYPEELPEKIVQGGMVVFDNSALESFKKIHAIHMDKGSRQEKAEKCRYGRVIAVTSGKGGVGKTNITLNLAIQMQRLNKLCVVLDADMGMANVHLLAGIDPDKSIMDMVDHGTGISELIMAGPEGIGIIPGGGGILGLADSNRQERNKIIKSLEQVEESTDIIIVDTGAGMGQDVRDFLVSADELLFVLTTDITSLADAYGLLKALHHGKMSKRPIYTVVNMVHTINEAIEVARRFSGCAEQFLGLEVRNIGYLLKDSSVGAACVRRTPYSVFRPDARVSKNTLNIAKALLENDVEELRTNSAFGRYLQKVSNNG